MHRRPKSAYVTPAIATVLVVLVASATVLGGVALARAAVDGATPPRPVSGPRSTTPVRFDPARLRASALEAVRRDEAESAAIAAASEPHFDAARAKAHAVALAKLGVRRAGSATEWNGFKYARGRFYEYGYVPSMATVALPGGKVSHNLVAVRKGTSPITLTLGAHMDSKSPSPGANDNASGVGVLLELARVFETRTVAPTIVFVLFGAEEMIDSNPDHHHYGSRAYVKGLTAEERSQMAGMISVDMVGYGSKMYARNMLRGPQTLTQALRTFADQKGVSLTFLKDEGKTGWSDQEAFELAGIPAVWLEWRPDPVYHTAGDNASHLRDAPIRTTGRFLEDYIAALDKRRLGLLLP